MMTYINAFDDTVLNLIQAQMHSAIVDKLMLFFSWIGNYGFVWIVIALLLMLCKKYRTAGFIMLIILLVCTTVGDFTLKPLLARARPFTLHPEISLLIPAPTDFSFPSGHTISSFGAATALFLLTNKRWGILGFVLAALIAFSRLYLYVHYPSDVFAGMLLGILLAVVVVRVAGRINKKNL